MKRIALLLCAVAMLVGLLAPYTIAATEAITYDENKDYVARVSGSIYYAASEDNPICSYSRNNRILGVAYNNSGWGYNTTFIQVTKGAYTGYTRNNKLIPMNKSYRVTASGYHLTNNPTGGGYAYSATVPINTILYYTGTKQTVDGTTYYQLKYYGVSGNPTGYLPGSVVVHTYGT